MSDDPLDALLGDMYGALSEPYVSAAKRENLRSRIAEARRTLVPSQVWQPNELLALSGKATPGPWRLSHAAVLGPVSVGTPLIALSGLPDGTFGACTSDPTRAAPDARFIVALVNWFRHSRTSAYQ